MPLVCFTAVMYMTQDPRPLYFGILPTATPLLLLVGQAEYDANDHNNNTTNKFGGIWNQ